MRIYEASSTFVRLSHGDPKSGETYKIKCHVNGDTVIWGNADGRWRTHELDSKITYQASDDILTVVEDYGDGSIKEEHFSREELGH